MTNQDKLLSDEKLEGLLLYFAQLVSYKRMAANRNIKGFYQMDDKASIDVGGIIKSLVAEINAQKRLYAESVIGEDEKMNGTRDKNGFYVDNHEQHLDTIATMRNLLRAEQRKRLNNE